jgi:hypothetical protein
MTSKRYQTYAQKQYNILTVFNTIRFFSPTKIKKSKKSIKIKNVTVKLPKSRKIKYHYGSAFF